MREDRVIAVIAEAANSTDSPIIIWISWQTTTRAGVAIDNALSKSIRERELSHILGNTADVIVVIAGDDGSCSSTSRHWGLCICTPMKTWDARYSAATTPPFWMLRGRKPAAKRYPECHAERAHILRQYACA
jgi:hypothetical protein